MPWLSFIRIGDNNKLSKSYLTDCVIGGTEKVHPMFFHRDSEGSKRKRSNVVEGLIEIGWTLPNGSDDKFNGPRLILNLRSAFSWTNISRNRLSDTTNINLMGENATYLRENLPIVVYAFLRMKLVGLHPRCTIVHHNVDKRNKDKLLEQGRVLEEVLNDLTERACKMENVPSRSFRDMIEFTIDENTDYVPGLLDGELPMTLVSTGYSGELGMDTEVESVDLEGILKELNLSKYYSGKLQRDDIFSVINNGSNHSQNVHLAQYINGIVHFNENYLDINEESDDFLSQLDSFSEELCVPNHLVGYKGMSHSDLREDLNTSIESVKGRHNFDDIKTKAADHHFRIDLNKIDDALKRSEILSNLVFQMFKEQTLDSVFPIQGHLCSEWCRMELEKYKLRLRGNAENVSKYRKRLEIKQNEIRSQQLQLITDEKCNILHLFVNNMSLSKDIEDVEVFLRNLKISIEMATRSTLLKGYEEYRNLFQKLRMMPAQTNDIHKEFRRLDEKLENQSLTFLDFSREMGHMYEILSDENMNHEYRKNLLDTAVNILSCGYEIEIMDGRSNWVPIIWVKSILLEVRKRLGNVRIKVITVLGVQSSGKSTLLNIMFGSQFAVGSGRCTRGMYMNIVKVSDKVSREFMVDYFLVIDTEGLYSSITKVDETNERDKTERELATFAIGMSHVTIINIMGEDMTYLHDILLITVHAFLRMDLVGLRPKCMFLHHTVEKSSNDKLLQNTFGLERILDEHTATACTLENTPKKRFRDIIHFDSIEDVYCFSPLFESVDDLKIVSSLYSKDAAYLKEKLILDTESVGTLEELANHVDLLWNAVKKDDFVFEFRDTVETQARVALDKRICHLQ
ncbi:interferon-induced very large GTPase 1-like [Mercenaria mercenaria]|uniref:interferon-induced very large GTPase 1-like n=1 Tax=Mercenaria mercenaria TaxID=6596 RepID=UPI00234F65EE|nr:interferon-induced very large GTPase 1-like [Mercenaria mercenaria]